MKRFVKNVVTIAIGRETKRGMIAPSPKNIPLFIRHISTRKPNTPAKQKPIIIRNVTREPSLREKGCSRIKSAFGMSCFG